MKKILIIISAFLMLVTMVATEAVCFDASFDIRNLGYAPAVADQGTDQTCWTFATMASIESNYLRRTKDSYPYYGKFLGDDTSLSKLHLAWFSFKNPDNKKNFAYVRNGSVISPSDNQILNHAGNPQMALAFLSRQDGPVRESALPYGSAYPAAGTSPRDYKPALRVTGAYFIDAVNFSLEGVEENLIIDKENVLKLYLIAHGAVSAGVYWDSNYMSRPNYAYYNPASRNGGHAITIIGWDDNYSRENFQPIQPDRDGAWLVQNSWGTSWGNNGYFWMSYDQLLRYAMVFEVEEANPNVREYFNDDLGFTHEISFPHATEQAVGAANIFKAKGDHEKLREIGFYSTNSTFLAGTLVLDLGTDNSLANFSRIATQAVDEAIDDESKFLDLFEGIADRGYLVHLLDKPVALTKDHYFAILTIMTPSDTSADFNPTIAAEVKIPNYRTANAEVNAQETYFSTDGNNWYDAKYHTFRVGANEITGFNACIKGFSYVPDVRFADDWTIISSDGKAQLSISLLKETEPREIAVTGSGIDNIVYKVERENASTGDAAGSFYTLKLICDLTSADAKLTSLKINGDEALKGSIKNIKYKTNVLEDVYLDISQIGVSFKDMTQALGVIESTNGYSQNGTTSTIIDNPTTDEPINDNPNTDEPISENPTNQTVTGNIRRGSSSSGCNAAHSVLSLGMLLLVFRRKIR